MRSRAWAVGAAVVCFGAGAARVGAQAVAVEEPFRLRAQSDFESVYAPPDPITANTGVNEGGVQFNLDLAYMTDYVYRGVNESNRIAGERAVGDNTPRPDFQEQAANIQIDAQMTFDL